MSSLYAVIMAGGSGTRFWPRSRARHPKQSLSFGPTGTLIQDTVARIPPEIPRENILLVTLESQAELLRQQTEIPSENVLSEPAGRDTAACITLAALEVYRRDPRGVMVVLAADHVIHAKVRFHETLRTAVAWSQNSDQLITLGITPTIAATGYGYIERGDEVGPRTFSVRRFHEKPDRVRAEEFFASGNFYWNSGIFVWRAEVILDAVRTYLPDLHAALAVLPTPLNSPAHASRLAAAYAALPKISIDKGVLEKFTQRLVVTADFDWDDVGTWTALARHNHVDEQHNTALGDVVMIDTKNCIIDNRGDGLVATLGVDDLIVVRAGDTVLVARRSEAERVKDLVEKIRAAGHSRFL